MDDPWGSPWTTTDTDRDIKPPSPAKSTRSDLEPPPRAFFSVSNAPKIPTPLAKSPWADDDDGFGDWAAPGTPAPAPSGWGGGWTAPSPRLNTPARDPDFGSASPIAWPGNIALSKPASSVSLRPPSPDPWSTESPPPIDDFATPRLVVDSPLPDEPKSAGFGGEEDRHDSPWTEEPETRTQAEISKPDSWPHDELRPKQSVPAKDGPEPTPTDQKRNGQSSVDAAEHDHEPPLSPSSGGDSDRDDGRPDSPITSIDEDARIRQPVARKVSGKVQVLVERFDGLARAQSEEPPAIRRQSSRAALGAEAETSKGFEDLQEGEDALRDPSAERTSTPRALEPATPPPSSPGISPPHRPIDVAATPGRRFSDHAPPNFDVNLKLVDELFGQSVPQPCNSGQGRTADVSECVLSDSFTEISERKTWYRVSRIGSSRRHNSGDDENYRMVTWPTSTVRLDTLKVVRRWMEEDSIAGRVTLGGGVSKTQKNMFGWDSSAEPLALDAALAKKRGAQRPSSVQTLKDVPGTMFDSLRSPIHRPSSVAIPPVASFSWSSNSPVTPHHIQSPTTIPPSLDARAPQPDTSSSATPLAPSLPFPVTTPPSQTLAGNDDGDDNGDDDDDWGEMISSPPSTNAPPTGLQSFELALPAGPQAILAPAARILPSFSTTATSLLQDELLAPSNEQIHEPAPLEAEPSKPVVIQPMPTATADPWEAVDLSVFELQPEPPAKIPSLESATDRPTPIVEEPADYFHHAPLTPPMSATKLGSDAPTPSNDFAVEQDFTPTTPLELNPPLPLPQSEVEEERPGFQPPEQDNAVRQIIDSLPDLSYMLR